MNIKDQIKSGKISFNVGDEVICFRRKPNGHPRGIKDNVVYTIKEVNDDGHLHVGIGWMQTIRVHKYYMIRRDLLRDIKLDSILNI